MRKFYYVNSSKKEFDLPTRGTKHSAGYDFHSPIDCIIWGHTSKFINLEVKCEMNSDDVLLIVPRSSLGMKNNNHITMTNTIGVIDSDYYNNENNEGTIGVKLYNNSDETFVIHKNDRIVQGIFVNYGLTDDDSSNEERKGGMGSTGK